MNAKVKLKPCPFCGCEEVIPGEAVGSVAGMYRFRVRCGNCLCYVGKFTTEKEAIEAWNTRPAKRVPDIQDIKRIIATTYLKAETESSDYKEYTHILFKEEDLCRLATAIYNLLTQEEGKT